MTGMSHRCGRCVVVYLAVRAHSANPCANLCVRRESGRVASVLYNSPLAYHNFASTSPESLCEASENHPSSCPVPFIAPEGLQ